MSVPEPDIDVKYADDYKEIFVSRIVGGWRAGYFEYDLISELSDFEDAIKPAGMNFSKTKIKRTIHTKVILPPLDFKELVKLFQTHLVQYEEIMGRILSSNEIADKQKRDKGQ